MSARGPHTIPLVAGFALSAAVYVLRWYVTAWSRSAFAIEPAGKSKACPNDSVVDASRNSLFISAQMAPAGRKGCATREAFKGVLRPCEAVPMPRPWAWSIRRASGALSTSPGMLRGSGSPLRGQPADDRSQRPEIGPRSDPPAPANEPHAQAHNAMQDRRHAGFMCHTPPSNRRHDGSAPACL